MKGFADQFSSIINSHFTIECANEDVGGLILPVETVKHTSGKVVKCIVVNLDENGVVDECPATVEDVAGFFKIDLEDLKRLLVELAGSGQQLQIKRPILP